MIRRIRYILYVLLLAVLLTSASCAPNGFLEYNPETQEKLDGAIHDLLIAQTDGWCQGEVGTEGHIILTAEEKEESLRVYIIADCTVFGFENGVFRDAGETYPAHVFPAVAVFQKAGYSEATLLLGKKNAMEEPDEDWLREMFPAAFVNRAIHASEAFDELHGQQKAQAKAYLEAIGRDTEIAEGYIEKQRIDAYVADGRLSKMAYNTLAEVIGVFNTFPDWIGTQETVENGTRYIYSTQAESALDGGLILVFTRILNDGTTVDAYEAREEKNADGTSLLTFSACPANGGTVVQSQYRISGELVEKLR